MRHAPLRATPRGDEVDGKRQFRRISHMRLFGVARWILGLCFVLGFVFEAEAAQRVALIIGNSAYQNVEPLKNPTNDADDIAKVLTAAGFDVIRRDDASRSDMADAVREFT